MTNRILTRLAFALAVPVLAAGCIEEAFPDNGTFTDDQLDEYSVELLLNGLPADLMSSNTAGYYSSYGDQTDFGYPSICLRTDYMLADIVSLGTPNYNQFNYYIGCLSMGPDYQYCGYYWDTYYAWIKEANEIISRIDHNTEDQQEREWLAQAYTYRAMFYLDLARLYIPKENNYVRVYANIRNLTVPIVTENTTEAMAQNNPRATREDMYDFILDDLDAAVTYFGNSASTGYTRPTLAAAYGLLARAYLEVGADLEDAGDDAGADAAYENAIKYADLAISTSGRTPLTQSQWEDPVNGFNNGAANNSWIWGLTLTAASTTNIMNHVSHMSSEATWAYGCRVLPGASRTFYREIDDADFRKHSWLDPDWQAGYYDYKFCGSSEQQENFKSYAKPYTNIKFRPASGEVDNFTMGSCADFPLMRVEEMYFIKIEATAKRDGNGINAAGLLEDFLNNYRYVDKSYTCEETGLSDFLEEMLFQKRVEFWGEGIVMYDHKRLNIGFTRSGSNFVADFTYDVQGRSPQWNIVIPRSELQANSAVTDLNNPDPTGFWY